jgi:hypothetical protein
VVIVPFCDSAARGFGHWSPWKPPHAGSRENALGCCTRCRPHLQSLGLRAGHLPFAFDSHVIAGLRFEHHRYAMQLFLPASGEPCPFTATTRHLDIDHLAASELSQSACRLSC